MPVGRLSGGEQARVLIARLMLQPADLLILDEPTNDLDIPTLEVLEESLLEFPGALVLVTHDRFLFERVTTSVLALDGRGGATASPTTAQWEAARQRARRAGASARPRAAAPRRSRAPRRRSSSWTWSSASGRGWRRRSSPPRSALAACQAAAARSRDRDPRRRARARAGSARARRAGASRPPLRPLGRARREARLKAACRCRPLRSLSAQLLLTDAIVADARNTSTCTILRPKRFASAPFRM